MGMTESGEETFEAAFADLLVPAFRVALRILGDSSDAEEVAAEAMARALRCWDRVGTMPHRTAWVVRVASNIAVDRTRRGAPPVAAPRHVPDLAEAATLRLALAAALRGLPRRQREVVALRYLADLPEADVAHSMGISLNSVKKHTSRAVATLRTRLGVEWQEASVVLE
jgi:RNA polymerase sigma factor (sigma-70 family)